MSNSTTEESATENSGTGESSATGESSTPSGSAAGSPPIACDFTAIGEEERKRHGQVGRELLSQVLEYSEVPGGYVLRLPTETEAVQKAGTFVSRERLCCPFLNFSLEVMADQGPTWLRLTGSEGAKEYLRDNLIPMLDG